MHNKFSTYLKKLQPSQNTPSDETTKRIQYLSKLPLFKGMPESVLVKIADQMNLCQLEQGDVLIHENDPSDSLFIIHKGWVNITSTGEQGEEVVLNQYEPGQILGETSMIDKQPHSNTVVALRPTEVFEVKYDVILEQINEHPALAISFLQEMSNRVRFANTYIGESIAWCRHIADGNYGFIKNQVEQTQATIVDAKFSDNARATVFLSVFFKMAETIQKREEALRRQVQELIIEIDESKREQRVQEVVETEFFEDLQSTAKKLRQERQTKSQKRSAPNDDTTPPAQ